MDYNIKDNYARAYNHDDMIKYIEHVTSKWYSIDHDTYDTPVLSVHREWQRELGEYLRYVSKLCQQRTLDLVK